MKKLALLLLSSGMLAAPVLAAAQAVAASPAAAPDTCPCTDYRFVPKTEKAKAVAAFWDARDEFKVAAGFGSMALLFSMMSNPPGEGLEDAKRALGDATDKLLKARARAVALHGLTVSGDAPKAPVVVTLKKGEDYELTTR
jgi:hypothetical protein